ncbi:MAG TPA: LacI family DNA-binding transcriptional regulator [Chloroflexia bacterium]|nr:LacI family DNA-binding transcriptional regulator [Chloroflexia bacterium]
MSTTDEPRSGEKTGYSTIKDVAKRAGVSISTVSKALNGQGKLKASTRELVKQAALELNFRPNDLAQSLIRGRSYTVGLLTTDFSGRFSLPLLTGIENALGIEKISVFLCNAQDDPERERQHVEALLSKKVDGIIVTGRRTDKREPIDVKGSHTPVIYAFSRVADPNYLCLLPDDKQGARLAVTHLIEQGRKNIAHITGPGHFEATRSRSETFRQVLLENKLPCPDSRILSGFWQEQWGYKAINLLLDMDPDIDGLFCGNDLIARGAIDGLRERKVRVPEDIAVVGFDNWEVMATATRPPLTTVDMNLQELGHLAAQKLIDHINGKPDKGIKRLPCRLVIRDSSQVKST